jgi:hypothetical protein
MGTDLVTQMATQMVVKQVSHTTKQMSVMEEKEINCTNNPNVHMMKLRIKNIIDLQKWWHWTYPTCLNLG